VDGIQKLVSFESSMRDEVVEDPFLQVVDSALKGQPSSNNSIPECSIKRLPTKSIPITMATLPNGQRMPLLKTMLTSVCEKNCNYCCFRNGRDFQRETFQPDELARTFMQLYQKGVVKGLFLSSGIAGGGTRTQDRILAAAEILRLRMNFKGYLHLKIMPGAEYSQVERAMQLADRVSINLEGPTTRRLQLLAPQKIFLEELLEPLHWVEEIRKNKPGYLGWKGHWPSSTTQFVAGGAGESDTELLRTTEFLHNRLRLGRVYYSGFNPVENTPLEDQPPINPWRTHRLYQASFLLRDYGFSFEEMPYLSSGNLPLEVDPKQAWAMDHLSQSPVEINTADYMDLIRVPGIGRKGALAILVERRKNKLSSIDSLKALGIVAQRASPFILLNGHQPTRQLHLW